MVIKNILKRYLPFRELFGNLYAYGRECYRANYAAVVRARYNIHSTVRWGYGTEIYGDGSITIGERTYIGNDCYISCHPASAKILIGKCCAIAHNVHIRTSNYARVPDFREAFDLPPTWADIVIGDYVWIGSHVYINAGVRIGENCIIGANSVVTHDVEKDTVVGGVPARVIHCKSDYASS